MHCVRDPQLQNKTLSHPWICHYVACGRLRLCRYLNRFKVAAVRRRSIKSMLIITAIDLCNLCTQLYLSDSWNTEVICGRLYNKLSRFAEIFLYCCVNYNSPWCKVWCHERYQVIMLEIWGSSELAFQNWFICRLCTLVIYLLSRYR
jgi:hypothetical protein